MILDQHQLVDFNFVKNRYRRLQKSAHPDKGGSNSESIEINLAFEKIKNLMTPHGELDQVDLISRVLLYFRPPPRNYSFAYILLFFVGTGTTLVMLSMKKTKKN